MSKQFKIGRTVIAGRIHFNDTLYQPHELNAYNQQTVFIEGKSIADDEYFDVSDDKGQLIVKIKNEGCGFDRALYD